MKAKTLYLVPIFFLLILHSVVAGPFGIEFGWDTGDLQDNNIQYVLKDSLYDISLYEIFPTKTHELVDRYYVYIDKLDGIVELRCHYSDKTYYTTSTQKIDARKALKEELSALYKSDNVYDNENRGQYSIYRDYWLLTSPMSSYAWVLEEDDVDRMGPIVWMDYKMRHSEEECKDYLSSRVRYVIQMPGKIEMSQKLNNWNGVGDPEWKDEGYNGFSDTIIFRGKHFLDAYDRHLEHERNKVIYNSPLI